MGFLDRLLGSEPPRPPPSAPSAQRNPDEIALERYRYMLRSAPPDTIEQAHAEAFAKLTPDQRRQLLEGLADAAPLAEQPRVRAISPDDTTALGRQATREELRRPGFMERTFPAGGMGGGMGMGGSLLSSFAMGFAGSMVANSFLSAVGGFGDNAAHASEPSAEDTTAADESAGADEPASEDFGGDFDGGGDLDMGGDF